MEKIMKLSGKLKIDIKETSQGVLGIVQEFPIVIESQDMETLGTDLSKAMMAYMVTYPKMFQEIIEISKIPA